MKKNFYFLVAAFFLISTSLFAQERNCYSYEYLQERLQEDPGLQDRIDQLENFTQQSIANGNFQRMNDIIYVPVVVHVVWDAAAPQQNISDAQIESQVDVIYRDFRALNDEFADIQANQWPQAADTQIEFYLAQIDPDGNPTNGIVRTSTTQSSVGAPGAENIKYTAQGGSDAWDPTRYFNFWVGNIGGGILGYATFPDFAGDPRDGIVMSPEFFGSSDYEAAAGETFFLSPPYDLGRTTTHEIGHYLNLRHIWGDGGCGVDDGVSDTPESDGSNFGCATGSVSCGTVDMAENYMDYSDDDCMGLFTQGQIDRMRAVFDPGGPREVLNQSPFPFALSVNSDSQNAEVCTDENITLNFTYNLIDPTYTGSVTFSASGLPASASTNFSPSTVSADGTQVALTISNLNGAAVDTYSILVETTDGTDTVPLNTPLQVFSDVFTTIDTSSPADGATEVSSTITLEWTEDINAAAYEVEVYSDAGFTNLITSGVPDRPEFEATLMNSTEYFWRTRAVNGCGSSAYATASFTTGNNMCNVYNSADTPIRVPADPAESSGNTTSIINVSDVLLITDVNVTLNIQHTWNADLDIDLISPDGTVVQLTRDNGGSSDNYPNTVFDDDATVSITTTTTATGIDAGPYTPIEPLSSFNNLGSAGDWTLSIEDDAGGDTGNLLDWSIEICGTAQSDSDGDGVPDSIDNCPNLANAGQEDNDGDDIGDICDDDDDNDGVLDVDDNCQFVANPDQTDLNNNGEGDVCEEVCQNAISTDTPVTIVEDNPNPPAVSEATVFIEENVITNKVVVSIDISHTYNGDLDIELVSPSGTSVLLLGNFFFDNSENFVNTVFDDDADESILVQPFGEYTGTFQPQEPLSAVNGEETRGVWTLRVSDVADGDGGSIDRFEIDICGDRDPQDFDLDGVLNDDDNCFIIFNDDQADNDEDGIGDLCDDDDDNDGVLDINDNCQFTPNTDQADNDDDGFGDVCDDDDDNDGVLDEDDNCQFNANEDQGDVDNDGIGDLCDDVAPNDILTPNGDGINDTWVVQSIQLYPGTTVKVYNRSGNEVFASNSYSNNWAGTNNGRQLPAGSYYYVIDQSGTGDRVQDGWIFLTY